MLQQIGKLVALFRRTDQLEVVIFTPFEQLMLRQFIT